MTQLAVLGQRWRSVRLVLRRGVSGRYNAKSVLTTWVAANSTLMLLLATAQRSANTGVAVTMQTQVIVAGTAQCAHSVLRTCMPAVIILHALWQWFKFRLT